LDGIQQTRDSRFDQVMWEQVEFKGLGPNKISHHTCSTLGDNMVLIGGISGGDDSNGRMYVFNIPKATWSFVEYNKVSVML
jgi:hypothetical protein